MNHYLESDQFKGVYITAGGHFKKDFYRTFMTGKHLSAL